MVTVLHEPVQPVASVCVSFVANSICAGGCPVQAIVTVVAVVPPFVTSGLHELPRLQEVERCAFRS